MLILPNLQFPSFFNYPVLRRKIYLVKPDILKLKLRIISIARNNFLLAVIYIYPWKYKFTNNNRAKDDFPHPEQAKSIVEEIKQSRLLKISHFVKTLDKDDSFFMIGNITPYEINIYRTLLVDTFNSISSFRKTVQV